MELVNFKCKTCGAPLSELVAQSTNGLVTCPYCGNVWTVPKQDTCPDALQFLHIGEHDLDTGKFDDAYAAYKKAAEFDPKEPEAYFGMALAEFKVQYLKDEASEKPRLQPICHEISAKNISENKNYNKALALATPEQRAEYIHRADEITKIRKAFYNLKESGLDYDCFICVKVSEEGDGTTQNKRETQDSHDALKLYQYLKDRGYAPFYSEVEVGNRTGADYEALILYALYSSECMLIVCSNEEYLQTKWVKNEYTRFAKMMDREGKEYNSLTFVFRGTPIEHLPGRDEKIQGIDLSKPDAYSKIEEYINSFRPIQVGGPVEIKRKEYTGAGYKKKEVKRRGVTKRELTMMGGGEISVSEASQLSIAKNMMQQKQFAEAIKYLNQLLRGNPSNGEAYLLRFLATHLCIDEENFVAYKAGPINYEDFEKAIACTDEKRQSELYDLLSRHVSVCFDLPSYKEYIELPGSTENMIEQLTDLMYNKALREHDRVVFDEVIKAVTKTNKFIKMNLDFAHAVQKDNTIYYKNILSVDEGHEEALWYVFARRFDGLDALLDHCLSDTSELETQLFAFGYNKLANDNLFELSRHYINNRQEDACKLFDFVLTMIPKNQNGIFTQYINEFIESLFSSNKVNLISKYNELLLGIDKLDDNAYFNRVLIKHKYHNPVELINIADILYDDEDYFAAINSYTEKYPDKKNFYIDLKNSLSELASMVVDREVRDYLRDNFICKKEELINSKDTILKFLKQSANDYLVDLLEKYNCEDPEGFNFLRVDITLEPIFQLGRLIAQNSHDQEIIDTYERIFNTQPAACKSSIKNFKRNKAQKIMSVVSTVVFIPATLIGIALTIFALINKFNELGGVEYYNIWNEIMPLIIACGYLIILTLANIGAYWLKNSKRVNGLARCEFINTICLFVVPWLIKKFDFPNILFLSLAIIVVCMAVNFAINDRKKRSKAK